MKSYIDRLLKNSSSNKEVSKKMGVKYWGQARMVFSLFSGKNLSESFLLALKEWASLKRIKELNRQIRKKPLEFDEHFSAEAVRSINRNR